MTPVRLLASTAFASLLLTAGSAQALVFDIKNLVSDGAVPAKTIDPDLKNPWGVARSPTGPFWVSNAETGTSTIYNGDGAKLGLTVTIPNPGGGLGSPTGVVFNGTPGFQVGGQTPLFIFDTEEGTIAGWAPAFGTTAMTAVDNGAFDAIYKGLAIGTSGAGDRLWAANFHSGDVETYDPSFARVTGDPLDPNLPAGFAPFNVQVLGGELYVAYAKQDAAAEDEEAGAGLGVVDVYTLDGTLIRRIASPGGDINAPWGLALAPSNWGKFGGKLLVGNFGDGTVSVFDQGNGDFLGKLLGRDHNPIAIDGLWALVPGNGGAGGDPDDIYFSAGIDDETHGLFGELSLAPEPAEWLLMLAGFGLTGVALRRRRVRPA